MFAAVGVGVFKADFCRAFYTSAAMIERLQRCCAVCTGISAEPAPPWFAAGRRSYRTVLDVQALRSPAPGRSSCFCRAPANDSRRGAAPAGVVKVLRSLADSRFVDGVAACFMQPAGPGEKKPQSHAKGFPDQADTQGERQGTRVMNRARRSTLWSRGGRISWH